MGSIYHHHIDSHISSSSSKRGVLCRARVRPVTDTAEAAATESIVAGCLQRWCEGTGGCVQRRFCINVYALPSLLLSRKAAQRRLSQIKHRLSVLAETRNPARRDSRPTTATFALDSPQQNHGDTVASLHACTQASSGKTGLALSVGRTDHGSPVSLCRAPICTGWCRCRLVTVDVCVFCLFFRLCYRQLVHSHHLR